MELKGISFKQPGDSFSEEEIKKFVSKWTEVMEHMKKWVMEREPGKSDETNRMSGSRSLRADWHLAEGNSFSSDSTFKQLALADSRFKIEAYKFVVRALGQAAANRGGEHVSGQDVALAFRSLALKEFGKNAIKTSLSWGVYTTDDIGTIIYQLIDAGRLGKRPEDKIEDFHALYDFAAVFPTD